jgi:TonB family protein
MSFAVSANGEVEDIAVVESKPSKVFVRTATRAVSSLEFRPCLHNGLATRQTDLSIKFDFNLI